MKILGTGLTGLIGSRLTQLLSHDHSFSVISRSTGVDITNYEQVRQAISRSDAGVVLHLAAYTNVKEAESEKDRGEKSESWRINVGGTENIVKACNEFGKKIIYTSTDLVFDGEHTPMGGYTESDKEHPLNWYAITKYEGELRVKAAQVPWVIIRPAYPYRSDYEKNDFVRLFIQKLGNNEPLTLLTDRIITPTFIDDLSGAIDLLIQKNAYGIYHTVGSTALSIYEAAETICDIYGFDKSLLAKTTRKEFLIGRPPEPFNSALNNAKIIQLGATMHSFFQGVMEVKSQREYKQ